MLKNLKEKINLKSAVIHDNLQIENQMNVFLSNKQNNELQSM